MFVVLAILAVACDETPTSSTHFRGAQSTPTPTGPALNYVVLSPPADRPQPVTNLAGRYRLDIDAADRVDGRQCSSLPASAARRTYTADIVSLGAYHAVKLYDAKFLADSASVAYACRDARLPQSGNAICHQFILNGDANALTVSAGAEDDGRGSEIWEGLPDGFVLEIIGTASGSMTNGSIEANGSGSLWYGNGLPATAFYSCSARAMRFTFTPK